MGTPPTPGSSTSCTPKCRCNTGEYKGIAFECDDPCKGQDDEIGKCPFDCTRGCTCRTACCSQIVAVSRMNLDLNKREPYPRNNPVGFNGYGMTYQVGDLFPIYGSDGEFDQYAFYFWTQFYEDMDDCQQQREDRRVERQQLMFAGTNLDSQYGVYRANYSPLDPCECLGDVPEIYFPGAGSGFCEDPDCHNDWKYISQNVTDVRYGRTSCELGNYGSAGPPNTNVISGLWKNVRVEKKINSCGYYYWEFWGTSCAYPFDEVLFKTLYNESSYYGVAEGTQTITITRGE